MMYCTIIRCDVRSYDVIYALWCDFMKSISVWYDLLSYVPMISDININNFVLFIKMNFIWKM